MVIVQAWSSSSSSLLLLYTCLASHLFSSPFHYSFSIMLYTRYCTAWFDFMECNPIENMIILRKAHWWVTSVNMHTYPSYNSLFYCAIFQLCATLFVAFPLFLVEFFIALHLRICAVHKYKHMRMALKTCPKKIKISWHLKMYDRVDIWTWWFYGRLWQNAKCHTHANVRFFCDDILRCMLLAAALVGIDALTLLYKNMHFISIKNYFSRPADDERNHISKCIFGMNSVAYWTFDYISHFVRVGEQNT